MNQERLQPTDYIGNGATISEPPIRHSVPEVDPIPWKRRLSEAPREAVVVPDVREGVPKDELYNFTGGLLCHES